jgi:hypothetical protein
MKAFALLIIAALLYCPPASATTIGDMFEQAPHKYRGPYKGKFSLRIVSPQRIARECGGSGVQACAIVTWEGRRVINCEMWMPNNLSRARYQQIFVHERAHCNGWHPDHRGGVWEQVRGGVGRTA